MDILVQVSDEVLTRKISN